RGRCRRPRSPRTGGTPADPPAPAVTAHVAVRPAWDRSSIGYGRGAWTSFTDGIASALGSEFLQRRVVVHELDPAGAAEIDQRHRRLPDAGHLLDPTQPVLVVVHPVAGLQHHQRTVTRPRPPGGRPAVLRCAEPPDPAPRRTDHPPHTDGAGCRVGAPPFDQLLWNLLQETGFRVEHRLPPGRPDLGA